MRRAMQSHAEQWMTALHKGRLVPRLEFPMGLPLLKVQGWVMHSGREACLIFSARTDRAGNVALAPGM